LVLTDQLHRSALSLIEFYGRCMLIENTIADGVEFFHIDAFSSAVALKMNCDLQLIRMASLLYHLLEAKIGKEHTTADSNRLFRDFIEAQALAIYQSRLIDSGIERTVTDAGESHRAVFSELVLVSFAVREPIGRP
jgi:hypothetical protein